MSVTDLGSQEQEFERTPPHDITAEQGVLGGMLLSQDAIAEVVEILRTADFYRPAHQLLFDAVLDLYGRGEPADAVTVAGELTKRGEIGRVGGAPYLHTLISSVPTAANAGYYAKIVRERSVLRKLVETGTRIVQMGYAADGADADEVLDRAQAEVFAIAEKRSGEDYLPLSEIMPDALDEIEAIGSRGGQMTGVPTGFADLDSLTNGLHSGQMIVVAARPAMGKALALDTPLPTPGGWTTMGAVRVGDHLIGADGRPTRVVAATEVMAGRPCYEVEFSDGERIIADAEHQWRTVASARPAAPSRKAARAGAPEPRGDRALRRPAHTGRTGNAHGATHHRPAAMTPLRTIATDARTRHAEVDAHFRAESAALMGVIAADAQAERAGAGAHVRAELARTIAADVWARRVEVDAHLRANAVTTVQAVVANLQAGRAEADAHTRANAVTTVQAVAADVRAGRVEVGAHVRAESARAGRLEVGGRVGVESVTTTRAIAADLRAGVRHAVVDGRAFELPRVPLGEDPYALGVRLAARAAGRVPVECLRASREQRAALLRGLLGGADVFTCADRALAEDVRELALGLGRRVVVAAAPGGFRVAVAAGRGVRTITAVRPVPSVPVRCVQVDNADHMYLAGRSCVPTHNSTLALDFARAASIRHGLTSAFFSLEMGRNEITMRLLSAEARVALHAMRSGTMQDEDWTRLARRMSEVAEAPLFIDDSPNMSMMEIRAKCRRLKQQHDLRLVIIDYLQLMSSGKRVESRQVEVSEFSRSLKLLAKELGVPVIALSQLNRGPEQRTDKKPMVSDLRESGSIEQDADMVILLHREDAYEKESPRAGEADLIVAKHRNGPTATVTVAFQGHYSRFVDMAQ
ncbi:replicative DNA helicase [Actinomadura atramentaria]|uniref:replicative DNA helicase n=1 Tax=Actinomadura atramentaria TaxID=1990 RepID=UPI0003826950|nr:replicative DNA helicase [Actinomadura atramentaria]